MRFLALKRRGQMRGARAPSDPIRELERSKSSAARYCRSRASHEWTIHIPRPKTGSVRRSPSESGGASSSRDAAASRRIIERDRALDTSYGRVFDGLIETMVKNPLAAAGAARLLFVAKHIERIGDYVKDICELNVYLTEAVFIKHSPHQ